MKLRLIDNWDTEIHRLWSFQAAVFLSMFDTVLAGIHAFDHVLGPITILVISAVGNGALALARLAKQELADGKTDVS